MAFLPSKIPWLFRPVLLPTAATGLALCLAASGAEAAPADPDPLQRSPLQMDRLLVAQIDGTQQPGSQKQSPYASAKDETGSKGTTGTVPAPPPPEPLNGTLQDGSEKESPYAAAKEQGGDALEPTLAKLWGLLLPLALAAGSYGWLRSREQG